MRLWLVLALALGLGGCKKKLDKHGACARILEQAGSQVAKERWMEACTSAEDQLVKCMGLGSETPSAKECANYGLDAPGFTKRQALVALLNDVPHPDVPVKRAPADAGVDAGMVGSNADHELWQAAVTSGDPELMKRVNLRLGLANAEGAPTEKMKGFAVSHAAWSTQHADFVNGLVDAAKARAFVEDQTK